MNLVSMYLDTELWYHFPHLHLEGSFVLLINGQCYISGLFFFFLQRWAWWVSQQCSEGLEDMPGLVFQLDMLVSSVLGPGDGVVLGPSGGMNRNELTWCQKLNIGFNIHQAWAPVHGVHFPAIFLFWGAFFHCVFIILISINEQHSYSS